MDAIQKKFYNFGIIPVIKIDRAEDAAALAEALCAGGLPIAEVTFRTAAAEEAMRNMRSACPDMFIGAGTVLTEEQVDKAIAAGAEFIVSPGLNPKVVGYCQERGVPIIPGISSPTEIETAIGLGLNAVKFFPAQESGGIAKIKAMSAPYPDIRFIPTGGIRADNLMEYLEFPKVLACGGSFMVSDALIKAGDFDGIRDLTRKAVNTVLGFGIKHVGINAADAQEAGILAAKFEKLFGFWQHDIGIAIFTGTAIEVMKEPSKGVHGHIAIHTNDIGRAMFYAQRQGFAFDMESAKYSGGKLSLIYLEEEIGGFAIHLSQK